MLITERRGLPSISGEKHPLDVTSGMKADISIGRFISPHFRPVYSKIPFVTPFD